MRCWPGKRPDRLRESADSLAGARDSRRERDARAGLRRSVAWPAEQARAVPRVGDERIRLYVRVGLAMARYARFEVNLIAFSAALLTVLVGWSAGWWGLAPALLGTALLAFYRDPPRRGCRECDVLLAPADGRVVSVTRGFDDGDGSGPALRIVIFLSIFDVHVNRSPCAGRVLRVDYRPGRFLSALRAAAGSLNESNTITILPRPPLPGPVRVRQVAGALARRIVCAVRPEDTLSAGQRFGMIKLGSQTELRVPEDPRWCDVVQVGARVYAGRTVLARIGPDER